MKTIVIGATGSGKTTFVEKLAGGGLFLDRSMLKSAQHCELLLSSYLHVSGYTKVIIDNISIDNRYVFQDIVNNNDSVIYTCDTIHALPTLGRFDQVWVLTVPPPYARFLGTPHYGNLPRGHGFVAKREDDYHWRPFTHNGDIVIEDATQWKLDEATGICYPPSQKE